MADFLIVDDNALLNQLVVETLEFDGHQALGFTSVNRAIAYLEAAIKLPDAIVLELELAGVDGCAFLERLARHFRWAQIPVITLIAARSHQQGAQLPLGLRYCTLRKPFLIGTLYDALARLSTADTPVSVFEH